MRNDSEMSRAIHRKTILIVDKDKNIRIISDGELSDRSFTTRSATSGLESMRFLKKNPKVDLLIWDVTEATPDDIRFPKGTGCRKLNIPVLLYSGNSSDQSDFPSWLAGVCPAGTPDLEELKKKVKEFLNYEEQLLRGWPDFVPA